MPSPRRFIIDTDPGVDDALAILMAYADPSVQVDALTVVGGNVGLPHTLRNAGHLAALAKLPPRVYAGCAEPLLGGAEDAGFVHGNDGFGDASLSAPVLRTDDEPAAAALIRLTRDRPGEYTLVALGPLTNLALALRLDPAFASRVGRLVVMGGAVHGRGNTAIPTAEFNIGFDPEAAAIVFEQFDRIELIDWETTVAHGPATDAIEAAFAGQSTRAKFMHQISRKTAEFVKNKRGTRWPWADPLAMLAALEPASVTRSEQRGVRIETRGTHTRGMTVVDWNGRCGWAAQTSIALEFVPGRLLEWIERALV